MTAKKKNFNFHPPEKNKKHEIPITDKIYIPSGLRKNLADFFKSLEHLNSTCMKLMTYFSKVRVLVF